MNKAKWLGFGVGGLIGSFVAEGLYKTIMQLKTHKIDLKILLCGANGAGKNTLLYLLKYGWFSNVAEKLLSIDLTYKYNQFVMPGGGLIRCKANLKFVNGCGVDEYKIANFLLGGKIAYVINFDDFFGNVSTREKIENDLQNLLNAINNTQLNFVRYEIPLIITHKNSCAISGEQNERLNELCKKYSCRWRAWDLAENDTKIKDEILSFLLYTPLPMGIIV